MSLKTINFTGTADGISPKTEQKAGTQGGHNTTGVVFTLDEGLISAYTGDVRYRIQFIDGAGGFHSTGFLEPKDGQITCSLPDDVTNAGGLAFAYLVITEISYVDGVANENEVFISAPGKLRFDYSGVGSPSEYAYRTGISGALENAEQYAGKAKDSAMSAEGSAEVAEAKANAAQRYANEAKEYENSAFNYASQAENSANLADSNQKLAHAALGKANAAATEAEKSAENAAASETNAERAATTANESAASAQSSAEAASKSAENAHINVLNEVENHNKSTENTHQDIRDAVSQAEAIAKGRARGLVFDTEEQVKGWLFGVPGKNLFNPNAYTESHYVGISNDGTIVFDMEGPGGEAAYARYNMTLNSGNYVISFVLGGYEEHINVFLDGTNVYSFISNIMGEPDKVYYSFTANENAELRVDVCANSEVQSGEVNVQLEKGTTATEYEEYNLTRFIREDGKTPADLQLGDNLYVVELGVPDYWWDGTTIQPLETEKPDLSDYATKQQLAAQLGGSTFKTMSRSEYDTAYLAGELDAGTIYFVYDEEDTDAE